MPVRRIPAQRWHGVTLENLEARWLISVVDLKCGQRRRGPRTLNDFNAWYSIRFTKGPTTSPTSSIPSNRTYIGNGETLAGGIGTAHWGSNIDISGFTLAEEPSGWEIENSSNINFHNNTIQNGNGSIVLGDDSNITIDNNTFRNDSGTSVGTDGPTSLDHVSVGQQ